MKSIIISEEQAKKLFGKNILSEEHEPTPQNPSMKKANKPYCIDPEKVKIVKKYLDNGFKRGNFQTIGNDGYPKNVKIVGMIGANGDILKNMYIQQLEDMVIDKFQNMFSDHNERGLFFKKVIDDWFNNKIGVNGTLSVNHL